LVSFVVLVCLFSASAQTLTIYCEENAPLQTVGADKTLGGFSIEIVREIQKRVGNHDPIALVPWARGYEETQKAANTALFSMGRTKERDTLFQWVGPIFESNYAFFTRADTNVSISTLAEARKLKAIGVVRNDVRDQYLTKEGFENLNRCADYATLFRLLLSGRIDCAVGSMTSIAGQVEQAGGQETDVKPQMIFLKAQLFVAFSKRTEAAIVARWNAALEAMKRDGYFEQVFRRYFPGLPMVGPVSATY
jgi:polar amino acid transport system substrate-binding protein